MLLRCTNWRRCTNEVCRHRTTHFKDMGCAEKSEDCHCKTASGKRGCHNWCAELNDPLKDVMDEKIREIKQNKEVTNNG